MFLLQNVFSTPDVGYKVFANIQSLKLLPVVQLRLLVDPIQDKFFIWSIAHAVLIYKRQIIFIQETT
jgi:hypothetical protein